MHPISEILCEVYSELFKQGQVSFPLQEIHRNNLDAVVKTVNATYFGVERFLSPEEKAVAYLYLLVKDHALVDGNKRMAIFWFSVYCRALQLEPQYADFALDQIAVAIEKSDSEKMDETMSAVQIILFRRIL